MVTPECVTFDLDDTLWNHRRAQAETLREIARESVAANAIDRFIERFHHHNSILWAQYRQGVVPAQSVQSERFARALRDAGVSSGDGRALGARYLERYGQRPYLCDGAKDVLEALAGRVIIGCVTDGFSDVQRCKLETTGIDVYFDFVVTSETVGRAKPDPALFEAAALAAGCGAATIVHVGDSYDKDVLGALRVGMRAAWVPRSAAEEAAAQGPAPDWILAELADLPAALDMARAPR
jgi:HAD superfamily hydrolase (TIGR01549 family)